MVQGQHKEEPKRDSGSEIVKETDSEKLRFQIEAMRYFFNLQLEFFQFNLLSTLSIIIFMFTNKRLVRI